MLNNVKHSVCIKNRKSLNFLPGYIFCNILIFIQVMGRSIPNFIDDDSDSCKIGSQFQYSYWTPPRADCQFVKVYQREPIEKCVSISVCWNKNLTKIMRQPSEIVHNCHISAKVSTFGSRFFAKYLYRPITNLVCVIFLT